MVFQRILWRAFSNLQFSDFFFFSSVHGMIVMPNTFSSCISAFLWQLMRFNILQLLKNLRSYSQVKEMTDGDILRWANSKVKSTGRSSQIESFRVRRNKNTLYFLLQFYLEVNNVCNLEIVFRIRDCQMEYSSLNF